MAVERLTDGDFKAKLGAAVKAVVCFRARWCGLCMLFAPRYERLSREYPDVRFFRCDGDRQPRCQASVPVDSLPFFAVYEHGRYLGGFTTTKEVKFRELLDAEFERHGGRFRAE